MWKSHAENGHQKLVADPNLIWQITQNSHGMQEIFFKNKILKDYYQKVVKKLTLFFLLNLVQLNEQSYQGQK